MDSINSHKNIENLQYKKRFSKNNVKEEKGVELKNVETSSLDVLSGYGRATINFRGHSQTTNNDVTSKITEFREKVAQDGIFKEFKFEYLTPINIDLAEELYFGKDECGIDLFPNDKKYLIPEIIEEINEENIEFTKKLCFAKDESGNDLFPNKELIRNIIRMITEYNLGLAEKLCFGKDEQGKDIFPQKNEIAYILWDAAGDYTLEGTEEYHRCFENYIEELCFGKDENENELFPYKKLIDKILVNTNHRNINLSRTLAIGKDKNGNDLFENKHIIPTILSCIEGEYNQTFSDEEMGKRLAITEIITMSKEEVSKEVLSNKKKFIDILTYATNYDSNKLNSLFKNYENEEITLSQLIMILDNEDDLTLSDLKKLNSVIGTQTAKNLSDNDVKIASKMLDLYGKKDISEIDLAKKKDVIRNLVSQNIGLYKVSSTLKKLFPLLPTNKDEYCSLLSDLCKSIGIETKELAESQIQKFNEQVFKLAESLATLSDKEFNSVEISQEYTKEDFIKNTFALLKDLSSNERQKVYDYFGFELKRNKNGTQVDEKRWHSFSIVGYPVNLNNGKKLAKIENEKTREIVEKLRKEVIRFSENNYISCSNKQLESHINQLVMLCPELRTQIGRKQHGKHEFDVFKHSLKVMQKVVQNPTYNKLQEQDKKIMLMVSLLHDGNKFEGVKDKLHANESAYDAFYITKKFKLSREETNKLFSLIKHHEWLGYTNNSKINDEEREKRIKSVAYDLHYDNLFEMSKIFTEADLKAIQKNGEFYELVKNIFDTHSDKIETYIKELKQTQPFLPVTKLPSASRINDAITVVNEDGSTNIKGIYKDKNGMIVIKYNEVENETWEKIGFPQGSISKNITSTIESRNNYEVSSKEINTGNIKFFIHGLEFQEQLRNFDVFALPDSDALLSVSYAERPESKYRFFRTQGVILNVDTQYVHGGGETDSGSGIKKKLDIFKNDYAFSDGKKHSDRVFISNLVKKELKLTDDEYLSFVQKNANRPISEIEPKEYQTALVNAFATINSATRRGERSYNEMYVTNPKVMGVFAYSPNDNISNVLDFIAIQPKFLKEYALQQDIPFILFGE